MTDTQMDLIRASAVAIMEQIKSSQDYYQVNEFLAGLPCVVLRSDDTCFHVQIIRRPYYIHGTNESAPNI